MKRKNQIARVVLLTAVLAVYGTLAMGSGRDSSGSTTNYDYHDAAGNGYNDDDVDWDNDGDGIGWDQAVDDWNRTNGIW